MKKLMMTSLLLLITVVGVGKIGLTFFGQHKSVVVSLDMGGQVLSPSATKHGLDNQLGDTHVWQGQWLMDELIPSAEAAKSMALPEEGSAPSNRSQVAELQRKKKDLELREKALDEREGEIAEAEKRAAEKIAALEALQTRIQALLAQEDSIKDKKIKRLTAVYEGMKADRAAPVIAQMDMSIVVKIFSRMSEKQVGKILSFLPPQKAVVISQALTKRIASIQ